MTFSLPLPSLLLKLPNRWSERWLVFYLSSHCESKFRSSKSGTRTSGIQKKVPNLLTIKDTSDTSDSKYKLNVKQFFVVKRKLLLSGDIELNPGPQQCKNSAIGECPLGSSWALLTARLKELGLCPLDVGGGGDCFFRSISHQMFGIPDYHTLI